LSITADSLGELKKDETKHPIKMTKEFWWSRAKKSSKTRDTGGASQCKRIAHKLQSVAT